METIKFRAYDADDKVMRSWREIDFTKDIGDDYYLVGYKASAVSIRYDHEQIIMQYTGLKDENGTEIYEGDIVRVTDDDGSTDFADGGIGTIGGMDELFMWYIDGDVHNGLYDIETTAYIEVIGNKYENSELLKEQNK